MIRRPLTWRWPEADGVGKERALAQLVRSVGELVRARPEPGAVGVLVVPEPPPRSAWARAEAALERRHGASAVRAFRWGTRGEGWLIDRVELLDDALALAFDARPDALFVLVDDAVTMTSAPAIVERELGHDGPPRVAGLLAFEWGVLREAWPPP